MGETTPFKRFLRILTSSSAARRAQYSGRQTFGLTFYPKARILGSNVYPGREGKAGAAAGHAGPADPANADFRPTARAGSRARDTADVGGRTSGGTRGSLPGAAAAGNARLDCGRMGNVGQQSPGEVLHADEGRAAAAGGRNDEVAAAGGGNRAGIRPGCRRGVMHVRAKESHSRFQGRDRGARSDRD